MSKLSPTVDVYVGTQRAATVRRHMLTRLYGLHAFFGCSTNPTDTWKAHQIATLMHRVSRASTAELLEADTELTELLDELTERIHTHGTA